MSGRAIAFLVIISLIVSFFVGCATQPPLPKPTPSPEVLEIRVTLANPPISYYTDEEGRSYYGVVVAGVNFDMRPIAINLVTWDEIFSWYGSFTRFHRTTSPDESPDPESQWSYSIPMPDSFTSSNKVVFRISLPDDLIGNPNRYRIVVFTKINPDQPPVKVTESYTYYPVDTLGLDLDTPEYIDFHPSDGYISRDDESGDISVPFPEVSSDMYNSLDITRVEVRILKP